MGIKSRLQRVILFILLIGLGGCRGGRSWTIQDAWYRPVDDDQATAAGYLRGRSNVPFVEVMEQSREAAVLRLGDSSCIPIKVDEARGMVARLPQLETGASRENGSGIVERVQSDITTESLAECSHHSRRESL